MCKLHGFPLLDYMSWLLIGQNVRQCMLHAQTFLVRPFEFEWTCCGRAEGRKGGRQDKAAFIERASERGREGVTPFGGDRSRFGARREAAAAAATAAAV